MSPTKRPAPSLEEDDAVANKKVRSSGRASSSPTKPKASTDGDYCSVKPRHDTNGLPIWPAPSDQVENARSIIRECAAAESTTVICPDKDADGLSAGAILHHTLTSLGLSQSKIRVHLLPKGETVHWESQRASIASLLSDDDGPDAAGHHANKVRYLFVLDHGSARSPPLAPPITTRTLVIDHHSAVEDTFPDHAEWVTAYDCPPVATSALLTYEICKSMSSELSSPDHRIAWLSVLGTHGDLGTSLKWREPFPDPDPVFKHHSKSAINEAVSLVNAPRRTATYDVRSAWEAVLPADSPKNITTGPRAERLKAARQEVNAEVARCQAYAPKFSYDSTIALIRIDSGCQVHPVIATRWAGTLKSAKKLKFVMCANSGYLPGMVNFSCRIAKGANERLAEVGQTDDNGSTDVNIISELKALAKLNTDPAFAQRLGDEFARGHPQASGGIIPADVFEELIAPLRIGEKPAKDSGANKSSPQKTVQKNKLTGYFGKAA